MVCQHYHDMSTLRERDWLSMCQLLESVSLSSNSSETASLPVSRTATFGREIESMSMYVDLISGTKHANTL